MNKMSKVQLTNDEAIEFLIAEDWHTAPDPTINPAHEHKEDDERIFVFGSNLKGLHGGGAAWYAHEKLGAELGVGEGRTGRTYALPTCYLPGRKRSLANVFKAVTTFLEHAEWCMIHEPDTRFFVTPVGCGIAGFKEEDIAPLFANAPENCDLPPSFIDINFALYAETLDTRK